LFKLLSITDESLKAERPDLLFGRRGRMTARAIDAELIREEWAPFAPIEEERTAWLEAVIAKRVVRRE
jgi:hypothetical protein